MFDDPIRLNLKAHMKSGFPSRACVMAYLDGKVAKGSNHMTVQSTNTDGLSWGSTVYVTTP